MGETKKPAAMNSSDSRPPFFPKPPAPGNEKERLLALEHFRILDTPPEPSFDDITRVAASLFDAPMATVTLIDSHRQWFKARIGMDKPETPRDEAFCSYTILRKTMLIVEETLEDERFRTHPAVLGAPHIRFYAGAPLITSDGYALGSLCVIDRVPRKIEPKQVAAMEALARIVVSQMEQRLVAMRLAQALESVKTLNGLLPICAYCKGIRNDKGYWEGVEGYINAHTEADFTHTICPNCESKHFPDYSRKH